MRTFEFLSKYFGSPVVSHRHRSALLLFKQALSNPSAVKQLGENLGSKDYDLVLYSMRVLLAVSVHDPKIVKSISAALLKVANNTDHYGIARLGLDALANIAAIEPNLIPSVTSLDEKLTPVMRELDSPDPFYGRCDHLIEYLLGNQDLKYELNHISDAFRYDCNKAFRKVSKTMRMLGYRKSKSSRESNPPRWRNDFYGTHYQTKLYYYSRHSIQIFMMWCVKNLPTSLEAWNELLTYERKWDPSVPELLLKEQPGIVGFLDVATGVDDWIKKRVKKEEVYKLINSNAEWVPLYEQTQFKDEDRSFSRFVMTAFIKTPVAKLPRKTEIYIPHYEIRNGFINELPMLAKERGLLNLESNYNRGDLFDGKLFPAYGIVSDEYDEYIKVFPAPEIVEVLGLTQKKNCLEYYKGGELVIQAINWRSGHDRDVDNRGEDRYEVFNYGSLLLIKRKYLKKYLKDSKSRLIAVGDLSKKKTKRWGDSSYDPKNSRHKRVSWELMK